MNRTSPRSYDDGVHHEWHWALIPDIQRRYWNATVELRQARYVTSHHSLVLPVFLGGIEIDERELKQFSIGEMR